MARASSVKNDNVDSLLNALESTHVGERGLSFAGKSLKLDTEEDAKPIVDAITKCTNLEYLNLEGNTLGVDAAKAIGDALCKHPELKRAIWKDMFTGRMKTEIPKALEHLGNGLVAAGVQLRELDLSDNAFGPIGVQGLASLLKSSTCYQLEELRLNNNGLGITGGKLLAEALTECYNSSKSAGQTLALKVFVAGRNRLENDGAKALAKVFKMMGTLEEVSMPQNGIYHVGINALSESFQSNRNLRIINLNDNTVGKQGASALAKALPDLQQLSHINFGDCLLKTHGALLLASAIKDKHPNLEDIVLDSNEIRIKGGIQLAEAIANKTKLKNLTLDANQFGKQGRSELEKKLKEIGKFNVLGTLNDNESEGSEEEDETEASEESQNENEEDDENECSEVRYVPPKQVNATDFLKLPSDDNFIALGDNRLNILLNEAKQGGVIQLNNCIQILMKVSALSKSSKENVSSAATKCSETLYKELFTWAQAEDNVSLVNNTLLVNLGLIKSEDKKFKPTWNVSVCINLLKDLVEKNYVPCTTKDTLKAFLTKTSDKTVSQ